MTGEYIDNGCLRCLENKVQVMRLTSNEYLSFVLRQEVYFIGLLCVGTQLPSVLWKNLGVLMFALILLELVATTLESIMY